MNNSRSKWIARFFARQGFLVHDSEGKEIKMGKMQSREQLRNLGNVIGLSVKPFMNCMRKRELKPHARFIGGILGFDVEIYDSKAYERLEKSTWVLSKTYDCSYSCRMADSSG